VTKKSKNIRNLILNKGVSFCDKEKAGVCVIFLNYRFYFLKDKPREWFLRIVKDEFERVPENFLRFLEKSKILVPRVF